MSTWQTRLSGYSNRLVPSAIRALADMPRAPDTIAFGPGEPDPALFPISEIKRSLDRILGDPAAAQMALQYGPSEGDPRLRDLIASTMASKGVACGREHVLLTNGSQQALHFVAALLVDPGDTVAVQAPTYPGALQIFAARGAAIRSIDELMRDRAARPKLIYAMANFQNPTGASLTLDERRLLLDVADTLGSVVVEDRGNAARGGAKRRHLRSRQCVFSRCKRRQSAPVELFGDASRSHCRRRASTGPDDPRLVLMTNDGEEQKGVRPLS